MSELRRVLAVDEQKKTLDFLRSVLSLVEGESFQVLHVLSAEEALLELRRQRYDLLICAYRLPGMDGLELIRRSKGLRPAMPIILTSRQATADLYDRAKRLGVNAVMGRPLDAEKFLNAVQKSLAGAPPVVQEEDGAKERPDAAVSPDVARRLEALCDETGADQVLLVTVGGEILYATGGQMKRDIPRLVALTAASVSRGLDLGRQLDEHEPRAVQFVAGRTTDLYWANVGQAYFVAILFDAQVRRGRIGTVWVFTQRAVGELNRLLGARAPVGPSEKPGKLKPADSPAATNAEDPVPGTAEPATEKTSSDDSATQSLQTAVDNETVQPRGRSPKERALDVFWEEALATDGGGDMFGAGISLEEAKAKGLVAEDFDPENLNAEE